MSQLVQRERERERQTAAQRSPGQRHLISDVAGRNNKTGRSNSDGRGTDTDDKLRVKNGTRI